MSASSCFITVLTIILLTTYTHEVGVHISEVYSNPLIDTFLASLRTLYKSRLDPLQMPNITDTVSKSPAGLKLELTYTLFDGMIHGLSNIHRVKSDQDTSEEDDLLGASPIKISTTVKLGLDNAQIDSGLLLEMNRPRKLRRVGTLKVIIGHIDIMSDVSVRALSLKKPKLENLRVVNLTGLKVKLNNLGLFGRALNWLSKFVTKHLNEKLKEIISKRLQEAIDKTVE